MSRKSKRRKWRYKWRHKTTKAIKKQTIERDCITCLSYKYCMDVSRLYPCRLYKQQRSDCDHGAGQEMDAARV